MPSFGTIEPGIEYRSRPGGYAVVVRGEKVGIVRTPRGYFLPGGGVEGDESLADAAVRETMEEVGLNIRITIEIGTADEFVHSPKYNEYFRKVCTFFSADVISESGDHEPDHELEWTTREKAVQLLDHGSQKWAVQHLF